MPPSAAGLRAQAASSLYKSKYPVFIVGAGLSAESGVPTFRGPEGFWRIGSRNYIPEEMATRAMFEKYPEEVWKCMLSLIGYNYRRGLVNKVQPNPGHYALVDLEKIFTEKLQNRNFAVITQNVDGLHLRAGQSLDRCFHVHGNINYMRDADDESNRKLYPIPAQFNPQTKDGGINIPTIPDRPNHRARPHVLWFDEYYEEDIFQSDTAMKAALASDLVFVIGTALQTNLAATAVQHALQSHKSLIEINTEPLEELSHFSSDKVMQIPGKSGEILPDIVNQVETMITENK
eukprot:gb/GECH01006856.1/.p1 GENE.gb/GECH01006856.1/~~gb/GECH01006856.1/.p1  ORF type:complete len:290 (+),score=52.55 gb/GECH01006856.1/:1-870(+)